MVPDNAVILQPADERLGKLARLQAGVHQMTNHSCCLPSVKPDCRGVISSFHNRGPGSFLNQVLLTPRFIFPVTMITVMVMLIEKNDNNSDICADKKDE